MKKEQYFIIRIIYSLFLIPLFFIMTILFLFLLTNDSGILMLLPIYIIYCLFFGSLYLIYRIDFK